MSKQPIEPLKANQVYGRRILVMLNVQTSTPKANLVWCELPKIQGEDTDPYDGKTAKFYDWKADYSAGTIYARGEIYMGNGRYDRFENTFSCHTEEVPLKNPGKDWEWGGSYGKWRNVKTGDKRDGFVPAPAKKPQP